MKYSTVFGVLGALFLFACQNQSADPSSRLAAKAENVRVPIQRVLLISIDGLHASDLTLFISENPNSTLAQMAASGVVFPNAKTTVPSDSFPTTAAMITGGSPQTTGIFFDDSYDRSLAPPGSDCKGTFGSAVNYTEEIDFDASKLDAGGGINPKLLPLDPKNNCEPVFPHQYLRVNTIFEVVKKHGGRTAWSDKHASYEFMQGPSGKGIDDLYNPEISANPEENPDGIESTVEATESYDDNKVNVILEQIKGNDHFGTHFDVPMLFGMNFQAISVAEKLFGYVADDALAPTANLKSALEHTDLSLKKIIEAIKAQNLADSTAILLTAKHGQGPRDPRLRKVISKSAIEKTINKISPDSVAHITEDDVALIWLKDGNSFEKIAAGLQNKSKDLGIAEIFSGTKLIEQFGNPALDSRVPDIIIRSEPGVIYTGKSATKLSEHGGFSDDDRNIAMLLYIPNSIPKVVNDEVQIQQIAPTVLQLLNFDTRELEAVQAADKTQVLPGVF